MEQLISDRRKEEKKKKKEEMYAIEIGVEYSS